MSGVKQETSEFDEMVAELRIQGDKDKKRSARVKANKAQGILPEREIQKAILDWLKEQNIFHYRSANMPVLRGSEQKGFFLSASQVRGLPDIVGIFKGKPLYIEVKASNAPKLPFEKDEPWIEAYQKRRQFKTLAGTKPRHEDVQSEFLWRVKAAGGIAMVARSVEDVKAVLDA